MRDEMIPTDRRPIGFWLKLVDRLIDERFVTVLGDRGLSRRHWQVLNILQQGEAAIGEIDRRLSPFLDPGEPTTQPVIEDLVSRGWAESEERRVTLTQKGAGHFDALLADVSKNRQRLIEGIEPEEYASALSVLERMARNLGWNPRD